MTKAELLRAAQQAADELGLGCRAHNASQLPEDPSAWCVLFTHGYGQVRVHLWRDATPEGVKDEIARQLRGREGRGLKGGDLGERR